MDTALSPLSRWTAECGLKVNQDKTELVPSLTLPKLHQTRLTLSNQAKNSVTISECRKSI